MSTPKEAAAPGSNFLRQIIERDLAEGTYAARHFAGTPGDAAHHAAGAARPGADPHALSARAERLPAHRPRQEHLPQLRPGARLRRRLPPALRRHQPGEGRAGVRRRDHRRRALARLRLDAPEPALGGAPTSHLYFASDYFDFMYRAAEALIERRPRLRRRAERRGDARQPRRLRHARHATARSAAARRPRTWRACAQMRDGELADGAAVLRAKIDMASPNINLRDPALYRIKRRDAPQHRRQAGASTRCTPTRIRSRTRSRTSRTRICTLEFEDQRPFYDWLLDTLCDARPAGAAAAAPVRVRAPQRHLRHHQQAQAQAAGRREASSTAGTTRACRRSSACAGAATRPSRSA